MIWRFVRFNVIISIQNLKGMIVLSIMSIPSVRPVSDLRQNMAEIMESIDTEKRPVILTKHGRGKYILLSIEDYNQLATMSELYKTIDEGIADIESGHVSDFREFTNQLQKDIKNRAMNGSKR